jgi:hypothetical protein
VIAIVLSTLLMAADPATPSIAPAAPTKVASADKSNGGEQICWEERPTGSHVSQRICESRDHLDKAKRAADDTLSGRLLDRPAPRTLPGR